MKNILALLITLNSFLAIGQLEPKMDSLFSKYNDIPGVAIAIYQADSILFKKGYGIANLDYSIPITTETVFDIGSISKQFTAASIVLLHYEGKLSFDDPVSKYIPELPKYKGKQMTIRHLLHHTSGIKDYLGLMHDAGMSWDDTFQEEQGIDMLSNEKKLNFESGSQFKYSNSGYLLLAVIVKRVSGMTLGEYAHKNIFYPLGMENTFIYEDAYAVIKNRAIGYSENKSSDWKRNHHFDFAVAGDGQVYSTVEDFLHWHKNYSVCKIGGRLFKSEMLMKGKLNNGDTINYAKAIISTEYKGHPVNHHTGSWGGFRSHYLQLPSKNMGIIIMSNNAQFDSKEYMFNVVDMLLELN